MRATAAPTLRTVPGTSVQAPGPASACTATSGSASSRATARCSVGRPATTTWAGRSDGSSSSHGPVRTARGQGTPDGSATTGTAPSGPNPSSSGAPWPAITSVGADGSSRSGGAVLVTGATSVHGPPPSRPGGTAAPSTASSPSGTRGSAKGRFRCTGPGRPPVAPVAAATARSTVDRSWAGDAPVEPVSASRTAAPKMPVATIVWLAPVPTSSGGRSAVSASNATPE